MGLSKLQQLNITLYTKTQFFLWEDHFFHVHKPDKLNCFGIVHDITASSNENRFFNNLI